MRGRRRGRQAVPRAIVVAASGTVEVPSAFHCNTGAHVGANAYAETFTAGAA